MQVAVPGYATIALEFELGLEGRDVEELVLPEIEMRCEVTAQRVTGRIRVPDEEMNRCELLVIGRPTVPTCKLAGEMRPTRSAEGAINQFAGYASHGMSSDKARPWAMDAYDLRSKRGEEVEVELLGGEEASSVEVWLVVDRVGSVKQEELRDPIPLGNGSRLERSNTWHARGRKKTPIPTLAQNPARLMSRSSSSNRNSGPFASRSTESASDPRHQLANSPN